MLENFFDEPNIFLVLREILEIKNHKITEINFSKILFKLGISPENGANILTILEILNIIKNVRYSGKMNFEIIGELNERSPILLKIMAFDDVVEKHVLEAISNY